MGKYTRQFARVDTVLVSAVANSGTFTVSYPTGFTQNDFTGGLAVSGGHYMIVNDNDKWTAAASKMSASFGASTVTITNSTGYSLAAGTRVSLFFDIVDSSDTQTFIFPIDLASITAADVVTDFYPRVDGTIEYFGFEVDKAVTTASKLATLNLEIGTTDVTGGVISLTSAAATPKGKIIDGTAITGTNTLTRSSAISVEATAVTAFSEGTGSLIIRVRKSNPDWY